MRAAYFEMIGGSSGNMLLGSLVDAGLDLDAVERIVRTVQSNDWTFSVEQTIRRGISATLLDVKTTDADDSLAGQHHRAVFLADVLRILEASQMSPVQKSRASLIYQRLASAEAKAHGTTIDKVHFHEVGATDAIVDIASFVVALDVLGVEEVFCSAFPMGNGSILMRHGMYPNPPPATAELLVGCPTKDTSVVGEMVTTTAAAILSTLCKEPGRRPSLQPSSIGYGAGHKEFSVPNVTRVFIGEVVVEEQPTAPHDIATVIEANIDDMSPQDYAPVIERLFEIGAWDVWTTPISMKKARPATLLSVLVSDALRQRCTDIMLLHTTTIGVRYHPVEKVGLPRELRTIETAFGTVRIKDAMCEGGFRSTPEFDDLLHISRERNMPLWRVRDVVNAELRKD